MRVQLSAAFGTGQTVPGSAAILIGKTQAATTYTRTADAATGAAYKQWLETHRRDRSVWELLAQIDELKRRVEAIEASIDIVDELKWEVALDRAREYFRNCGQSPVYPDELASAIETSVSQAIEICEALEREGDVVGS